MLLKETTLTAPYTHKRRIRFGETDAATIVYTARFFEYALDAIDAWYVDVLTVSLYDLNIHHEITCPFVHASIDFKSALRPGNELTITVLIQSQGRSSLTFQLIGTCEDSTLSFTGEFTLVFVDVKTMRSMPIPQAISTRIDEYQCRCEENLPASEPSTAQET
ncbi:acyl-CoA thioesterase [Parapusillimonas granuli]|uniref:Acyl-CoA thioesterase n=1 Tax=Parapusillimonas granuli TaxID=380911 RepID=A0A853G3H7_9BURK|nr:thioesterase family protein [Parapusillimonas granuli]MBB5215925.1 YbgC/YbaW family acyl-CoA thioester hydrolase [Parapusillimonas granuli]NYT50777.1 acyl-CoA thioesterase [Parapusillimonas granuli]